MMTHAIHALPARYLHGALLGALFALPALPVLHSALPAQAPVMLKDVFPGTNGSRPENLVVTSGRAWFVADDGVNGREVWTTDGTPANTRLVADIMPNSGRTDPGSHPQELTVVGDKLFFTALIPGTSAQDYGRELIAVDLRTHKVTVIDLAARASLSGVSDLIAYQGRCFFQASGNLNQSTTAMTGPELWSSDGTIAGTRVAYEFAPGTQGGHPKSMVIFQGQLYCAAASLGTTVGVWKYDGNVATRVTDPTKGPDYINPAYLTPAGNRLFFAAKDKTAGVELYVTDGTAAGTTLLDLYPGGYNSNPAPAGSSFGSVASQFMVAGGLVYFSVFNTTGTPINGSYRNGLWVSDGTLAGTLGFNSASLSIGEGGRCVPLGDKVLFQAVQSKVATLYLTDGTRANTVAVAAGSMVHNASIGARHVYFTQTDTANGTELWRTDGTSAGTRLVADVEPNGSSHPIPLGVVNGKLLFQASTSAAGAELYAVALDAHTYPAGRGCGGKSTIPVLSATDPVIGLTLAFRARQAPASRAGLLAVGLPGTTEQLLGNCSVILDLSLPLVTFPFATDNSGVAKLAVPVPNNPGLAGLAIPVQSAFGPTFTGPSSLDFSNGLMLHPGVK